MGPGATKGNTGRRMPLGPRHAQRPGPSDRPGSVLVGRLRAGPGLHPRAFWPHLAGIQGPARPGEGPCRILQVQERRLLDTNPEIRALQHGPRKTRLRPSSAVPGGAGESGSGAGAPPRIPLHSDNGSQTAGLLPFGKQTGLLAARAAPGPRGRDSPRHSRERRDPGGRLGRHRVAEGEGPATRETDQAHRPEGRRGPARLVVPGKGRGRLEGIEHQHPHEKRLRKL